MTVKERKPWRQTPLIESNVLSKAAGWYGELPDLSEHYVYLVNPITKSQKQNLPKTRELATGRFLQVPWRRQPPTMRLQESV